MTMNKNWFKHDINAFNNPKLQTLIDMYGGVVYGFWWRIVETLHEKNGEVIEDKRYEWNALARQLGINYEDAICMRDTMVEFKLLVKKDGGFTNERVVRQIDKYNETSKKRSESGKIGASIKHGKSLANAKQVPSKCQAPAKQILADKIRLDKIKKENKKADANASTSNEVVVDFDKLMKIWNDLHKTNLRLTSGKKKQILARLKTFDKNELYQAMKNRANNEWFKTPEGMQQISNWDSFWRNDEQVDKYLNASFKKNKTRETQEEFIEGIYN